MMSYNVLINVPPLINISEYFYALISYTYNFGEIFCLYLNCIVAFYSWVYFTFTRKISFAIMFGYFVRMVLQKCLCPAAPKPMSLKPGIWGEQECQRVRKRFDNISRGCSDVWFLLKCLQSLFYLVEREERGRDKEAENAPICWFFGQVLLTSGTQWGLKPCTQNSMQVFWAGTWVLEPSPAAYQAVC